MAESNNKTEKHKREESAKDVDGDEDTVFGVGKDILEFFKNLNWNVVDREELEACSKSFLPQKNEYRYPLHAMKLVESELVLFPEKAIRLPPLPKDGCVEKVFYVPGVDSDLHINYPRFSALTRQEQIQLFYFYSKSPTNSKQSIKTVDDCQELIKKASEEYKDFQDFVQQQWIQHQYGRCLQVSQEVLCFLDHLWQTRASQCLAVYPAQYRPLKNFIIPLALNDPNNDHALLEFSRELLKQDGIIWKMLRPHFWKPWHLISRYDQLCRVKSVSWPGQPDAAPALFSPAPPVSVDPMVDMCLEKESVDIIMTCSGIKVIVDTYNTQKDWTLPVTVKNVLNVFGNSSKKVVIIDKKLPASAMSTHDKSVWHAKIASKWALIQIGRPHLFHTSPAPSSVRGELTRYDDLCTENSTTDEVEFGVNQNLAAPSRNAKTSMKYSTLVGAKEKVMQDNKTESLTKEFTSFSIVPGQTNLDTKKPVTPPQKSNVISKEHGNKLPHVTNASSSAELKMGYKRMHPDSFVSASDKNETRTEFDLPCSQHVARRRLQGSNSRLVYKLWQLRKSQHYNMAKHEQRTLNILVRNRDDGRFEDREVCVSSLLEFQPEFGACRLDKSQLVREYVDLYLRQNSDLIRVRTVGHTGEVMITESKTLKDVKEALNRESVKWHTLFDPLYAILTRLVDLVPGVYMLQHSSRQGPFVNLLKQSEGGCWSLASELSECRQVSAHVPARQIDPHTLTSLHHRDRVPPAVFPTPAIKTGQGRFLKRPPPVLKKKKGPKKSKKKQKRANF